jgi:hypothetical protein
MAVFSIFHARREFSESGILAQDPRGGDHDVRRFSAKIKRCEY